MRHVILILTIVITAMAALATIPSEKQPVVEETRRDVPWRLTNDGWVAATWLERAKLAPYQPSPLIYFHPAALAALIILVSAGSLVLFDRQEKTGACMTSGVSDATP